MKLTTTLILFCLIITVFLFFRVSNNFDGFMGTFPNKSKCTHNDQCKSGYCRQTNMTSQTGVRIAFCT